MVEKIKKELRTGRGKIALFVSILTLSLAILLNFQTSTSAKLANSNIRNIDLVIRNMSFGDNNPTFRIHPGESVRFIIHNFDKGMKHDFSIEGTKFRTRILDYGEADSIIFQAPVTKKKVVYLCSLHALKMRGILEIK